MREVTNNIKQIQGSNFIAWSAMNISDETSMRKNLKPSQESPATASPSA